MNAESNQVYATLKSFNTCTVDGIPNMHKVEINSQVTLCYTSFDSCMQAACEDVRVAAVEGICRNNAESNQVYATPKSFNTHTLDWIPNTHESGINQQ